MAVTNDLKKWSDDLRQDHSNLLGSVFLLHTINMKKKGKTYGTKNFVSHTL